MSNYLENIRRIKSLADESKLGNHMTEKTFKIIAQVFQEKLANEEGIQHSFIVFYEDVISDDLVVDFSNILSEDDYNDASEFSSSCLQITSSIQRLPKDMTVGTWILYALKFIDYIVIHYIQEVKKEIPDNNLIPNDQVNYGEERLRYKMLARYGDEFKNVSNWLDRLYSFRTRIHHNTLVNKKSGRHSLRLENHNRISQDTLKIYPKILNAFKVAYL